MKVGLVFGGRSVEHQVSVRSARTVAEALAEAGYEVVPLPIGPDGGWLDPALGRRALDGEMDFLPAAGGDVLRTLTHFVDCGVDAVFPVVHGTWGEDGTFQGLCEMADLPYVGAGVSASAVAMDKLLAKQVMEKAGVPVVDYEAISRREFAADPQAALARIERLGPLGDRAVFVKPSVGGSSVGVAKVTDAAGLRAALADALELDENVLVEKSIDGRELECAVLGYPDLEASAVGEIRPGRDFYDYADKYLEDGAELLFPAELDDEIASAIRRSAVDAFAAVGGSGMARVDFLLEAGGAFYVNEINTLPGFTSISMYPKLWGISGVPLPELASRLVQAGVARHADRQAMDRRIKGWLAELGSENG